MHVVRLPVRRATEALAASETDRPLHGRLRVRRTLISEMSTIIHVGASSQFPFSASSRPSEHRMSLNLQYWRQRSTEESLSGKEMASGRLAYELHTQAVQGVPLLQTEKAMAGFPVQ